MDIILHIGAHCTGTLDFQAYLHRHRAELAAQGIGLRYPRRSFENNEQQAFFGAHPNRAGQRAPSVGIAPDTVIVSNSEMAGTLRGNLETGLLYPAVGARVARIAAKIAGSVTTILLCPRSLPNFWCSAVATAVAKGADVPERKHLARIAEGRRGWRDVITEIAQALPKTEIRVLPFESTSGRPDTLLELGAGVPAPASFSRPWADRTPTLPALRRVLRERGDGAQHLPFGMGQWNPFDNSKHAALRELYADDMMWLTAGADGLATLIEDRRQDRAGKTLPQAAQRKGHPDEFEERQMARPGQSGVARQTG